MTPSSEAMLRAALSMSREALFVIDVDAMDYVEFNDAMCHLAGRSREELVRLGPVGMWNETGGLPQSLRQHYDALVAQSPTPMSHVTAVHRPDGSFVEVWAERQARRIEGRWVILGCAHELHSKDAKIPVAGYGEETEASLRDRIEANPHPASLIDYQAMRYIEVNQGACDLLGYTRDELLEGDLPLSGDRTLDELRDLYAGIIMRAPQSMTEETIYQSSDGTDVRGQVTRRAVLVNGVWLIYVEVKRL